MSLKNKTKAVWRFLSEDDFMVIRIVLMFASALPFMILSNGEDRTAILFATIIVLAVMFFVNAFLAGIRNRNENILVGFACLVSIAINLFMAAAS